MRTDKEKVIRSRPVQAHNGTSTATHSPHPQFEQRPRRLEWRSRVQCIGDDAQCLNPAFSNNASTNRPIISRKPGCLHRRFFEANNRGVKTKVTLEPNQLFSGINSHSYDLRSKRGYSGWNG